MNNKETMTNNRFQMDCQSVLQILRKDEICGKSYVTFKNIITGETITYEDNELITLKNNNIKMNAS